MIDEPQPTQAGATVIPAAPQDELLVLLDAMQVGQQTTLSDGSTARAEAAYNAASGRRCRFVEILAAGAVDRRLACREDGNWDWYPIVLP